MKKYLILLLLLTSLRCICQTDQDLVRTTFVSYFKTIEEKNNSQTIEYIYPKLFEMYPKDKMLESMNKAQKDTTTIVSFNNLQIKSISKVLEIESGKYCLINYSSKMAYQYIVPQNATEDQLSSIDIKAMFAYQMFKERYGDKNVKLDEKNKVINVNIASAAYAIKEMDKEWKFLEKKENQQEMLRKLLPEKVVTGLK